MPFNVGPLELIIILVIALLILGPGKLPEVGSSLGKSIKEFRKAATDVQDATKIDLSPMPPPAPSPAPVVPAVAAAVVPAPVDVAAPASVAAPVANALSDEAEPNVLAAQTVPSESSAQNDA